MGISKFCIKAGEKLGIATYLNDKGEVVRENLTQEDFFKKISRPLVKGNKESVNKQDDK